MRIGFLVNDVKTEKVGFTTVRLATEAVNQGHDVFYFGVGDLVYDADDAVRARARTVTRKTYGSHQTFFKDLQGGKGVDERITVDDLDVLMLRNVPSDDIIPRPWAATSAERPHVFHPPSTITRFPVFLTDSNSIASSRGFTERKSITSE